MVTQADYMDAAPDTSTAAPIAVLCGVAFIVAVSGFAGLGYEVTWTRMFSVSLGTEMMAVLGSIAGFFGGLALGAFALDARIRRAKSPWVTYAILEAIIGGWGLASIWLLPAAGRLIPYILGANSAPAALWFVSFALPMLALLPATVAMGGTLTALERMLTSVSGNQRVSAGVYGANTAGAVAGTVLSTFWLFPMFGISGTLAFLAALNLICAVGGLIIARAGPSRLVRGYAREETHAGLRTSVGSPRLTLTLFSTGLLGIAFEVLVVRLAAQTLQNTIYTFAALLAACLLGTAAGGLIWQRAGRHCGAVSRSSLLLGLTSLACLGTAGLVPLVAPIIHVSTETGISGEFGLAITLFFVPAAIMGALFGQLAQEVRDLRGSLGWAVGINSIGADIAPFAATQLLIPVFGVWRAIVAIAVGYSLLAATRRATAFWLITASAAALLLWLGPAPSLIRVPPGGALLAVREGPMVTASAVSDASGARYLEVNGHFRMGGTSSMRSDYRQAMLPLLLHPAPRHALFLGVGTGATLIGGARMPDVEVRGVELSPEVVQLLPWFTHSGTAAPQPPISVADARRYVVADQNQYDVIIADLFHPALEGSGALYTREHFSAVRKRLAPGGLFCQWLPLYQLDFASLQSIIRTFLDVYPEGSAWLNHLSVRTPMLVLVGPRDHLDITEAALEQRLRSPSTADVAAPVGLENPMDLLGQYVGGARVLSSLAQTAPRNTDDYPFVTLDARKNVRALAAPPWELLLSLIRDVQPDADELLVAPRATDGGASRDALRGRLLAYWHARDRFLQAGASLEGDPRGRRLIDAASPGLLAAVRLSAEFDPAYRPLIAMARSLLDSDREAARTLLQQIDEAAPARPEAREMLSREFPDR